MNITPDQADRLKRDATDGPWLLDQQDPDEVPMIMSMRVENGLVTGTYIAECVEEDGDARLIAAAPDLAQTIAGMRWEHTFQTRPRGLPWREWTTQEDWFDNHDAAYRAAMNVQDAGSFNCRLVRRLVGPVEVVE